MKVGIAGLFIHSKSPQDILGGFFCVSGDLYLVVWMEAPVGVQALACVRSLKAVLQQTGFVQVAFTQTLSQSVDNT